MGGGNPYPQNVYENSFFLTLPLGNLASKVVFISTVDLKYAHTPYTVNEAMCKRPLGG